jgi:ABC-type taurine transport system ATPase subunit
VSRSRAIGAADRASLTARLTPAVRRRIASGRTVRLRLTAAFTPKAKGRTTRITKTVTVPGTKRRR